MKTLSKKLLSLLLVAVMLVAAMPVFAFADGTGTPITDLYLYVDSNSYTKYPMTGYTTTLGERTNTGLNGEAGALLAAAGLASTYPLSGFDVKEVVINPQKETASIKLTTKTVEHHYTVLVPGSGTADGHLLQCDGTTCGNSNCRETTRVAHGDEHFTLSGKVDATCTKEGNTGTKTYDCGYVEVGTTVAKLAHNFGTAGKGKCATCGAVKYIVDLTVDGTQNTKELVVEEGSKVDVNSAAGVLAALNMDASKYTVGGSFTNTDYVITFSVTTKDSTDAEYTNVTLYDGNKTTVVRVEVGTYYAYNGLFNPSATYGRTPNELRIVNGNSSRFVKVGNVTDANGKVRNGDSEVYISWNSATRTVNFYTDSTKQKVEVSRSVYQGYAIGELPKKVGNKEVEYWSVWGDKISSETTYDWQATSVDAIPHFVGETNAKVYLEIYVNGNRTSKYAQVDITNKLQSGYIYRDTLLSAIQNATKNNSLKLSSVSYLFEEADWSQYVRDTKNTTTKTSVYVGDSQDARYIYVMVNGVTTKTTDPSNPKTGDSAKLGVAAAVLAVAVVGFGAVTVISKKKGAI